MNITVQLLTRYGKQDILPVCDKAKTFADLAGTKTLTERSIALIKDLGYTIQVQQDRPATL